jgi:regulator of protease activity HflC (stomatin/prohibitin superfamily)
MTLHSFLRGALILGAPACATTEALHTETSTAAIRSAQDLGAATVPQAALHLQLAQEEMKAAEALNAKGQQEEGKSLLLRAEADAELAVALSRADADREAAIVAMDRVRKLESENPYAPGGSP